MKHLTNKGDKFLSPIFKGSEITHQVRVGDRSKFKRLDRFGELSVHRRWLDGGSLLATRYDAPDETGSKHQAVPVYTVMSSFVSVLCSSYLPLPACNNLL